MKKAFSKMTKDELLTELKKAHSLLEEKHGFFLIWSGLKKIQNRFRKEFPLFIKDLQHYGKESKAFFLTIKQELTP